MIQIPPRLYKYYSINEWSMKALTNNELFFSSAEQFNDPFDTQFELINEEEDLDDLVEWMRKLEAEGLAPIGYAEKSRVLYDVPGYAYERSDETLRQEYIRRQNEFKNILVQIGISCLSECPDCILMWSHYAQQHKGFCLEFSDLEKHVPADVSFQKVYYRDDVPSLSVKRQERRLLDRILRENRGKSLGERAKILAQVEPDARHRAAELVVTEAVASKHTDWAYEREWRAIVKRPNTVVQYAPQALTAVIFGMRTPTDDRKAIVEALAERAVAERVDISEAVRVPGMFAVSIRNAS